MTNICLAQEKPLELAYLDRENQASRSTPSHKEEEKKPTPALLDKFLPLDLNRLPYEEDNYWTAYANSPRYHINHEYFGIQKLLYSQVEKLAKRYYRQQLRIFWEQSNLHPMDQDRLMRRLNQENTTQNQWWNRTWYDSLPPEKGGQLTYTQQVGEQITIFKIGPLSLNNDGKFACQFGRIDIEENPEVTTTDLEALQRGELFQKYNIGLRTPETVYGTKEFQTSWGIKANIRVDKFTSENKTSIGVNFKLKLLNNNGIPYLAFQASAEIQPLTNRAEARFQLVLLEF